MIRLWPFTSNAPAEFRAIAQPDEAPFVAILEALPEPVMVVRGEEAGERRITFANAAARDFFRLVGQNPMLVSAVRRPEVLEAIESSLSQAEAGEAAFELQDRMLKAISRPLQRADGARHAVVMIRDETDARRSARMRADFLANASHELRTPLASVKGFIETLRGHAKDDPAAREKFLGIMAAQAERMGRLIEDLMSLSRIELNEHVPPAGEVDVALAAADVVDAVAPIAAGSGVKVELSAAPGALVQGDRDQLVQVIQNLVDNALKYSPADKPVTVEVVADVSPEQVLAPLDADRTRLPLIVLAPDADARFVVIRVADEGPGIPRDQLPRLTERFYRAPGQKSGDRSGTGLGLAIVKHIVNRHRGGLIVESAPGMGAVFTAYLPARTVA